MAGSNTSDARRLSPRKSAHAEYAQCQRWECAARLRSVERELAAERRRRVALERALGEPGKSNVLAVLALVFGALSIVFGLLPYVGIVGFLFGVAAAVLGAIGVEKSDDRRMCGAGALCGVSGILIALLMVILVY